MNPKAATFTPVYHSAKQFSTTDLSQYQIKSLLQISSEWLSSPTLDYVLRKWEARQFHTEKMLIGNHNLSFLLLNINSLKPHLYDLLALLDTIQVSIIILNGTRHDSAALKELSAYLRSFNVFVQRGSNHCGGVLIATHRSIPVQRVSKFDATHNLIVLEVGNAPPNKLQIATCYSPPLEDLPWDVLDDILRDNPATILLGDFNAKHRSWSESASNSKGFRLAKWIDDNSLQVINKSTPTSTRSVAAIDLIIAPHSLSPGSVTTLPSVGSDHLPILWTADVQLPWKAHLLPIKRTCWSVLRLFLDSTSLYWADLYASMTSKIDFLCLYERFLQLAQSRLTSVHFSEA